MRQAALSAFIGAAVAAVALLIGGRKHQAPATIDGVDLKPGTHVTIVRQIPGEKACQWYRLRVYRGSNDRVTAPKGNIWELAIDGGSHVFLVEDQPAAE